MASLSSSMTLHSTSQWREGGEKKAFDKITLLCLWWHNIYIQNSTNVKQWAISCRSVSLMDNCIQERKKAITYLRTHWSIKQFLQLTITASKRLCDRASVHRQKHFFYYTVHKRSSCMSGSSCCIFIRNVRAVIASHKKQARCSNNSS